MGGRQGRPGADRKPIAGRYSFCRHVHPPLRAAQPLSGAAVGGLFIEEVFDDQAIDLVQSDTDLAGDALPSAVRRTRCTGGCFDDGDDLLRRSDWRQ